jgi:hypothetical protein
MSDINSPPSSNLWTEPQSAANAENPPIYPYNNIQQTEAGHSFEMDDTPARERVRLTHRSGTFIEMHPNGDEVHKVYGDGYEITIKNKNVLIKGVCNITVNGNSNLHVLGDYNVQVDGDYNLQVAGKMNTRVVKDVSISGDADVSITANENFGGTMHLSAADSLYIASDLVVGGSMSADIINSTTRVNAGTGVYAGPLGFVSGLGGLSLGIPSALTPVAVPGCINTVGSITSLTSVNAPIANFAIANCGVMDAVLMTDVINSKIYDFHIHNSPKGPTSPPLTPFVGI